MHIDPEPPLITPHLSPPVSRQGGKKCVFLTLTALLCFLSVHVICTVKKKKSARSIFVHTYDANMNVFSDVLCTML